MGMNIPNYPSDPRLGTCYILELFCRAVLEMLCTNLPAAKFECLPQQQDEPPWQRQGQAADVAVLGARWHTCGNVRTGTCQLPKPTNSWASSRRTNTTTACPNSSLGLQSQLVCSINKLFLVKARGLFALRTPMQIFGGISPELGDYFKSSPCDHS